jgi:hypothetical protein
MNRKLSSVTIVLLVLLLFGCASPGETNEEKTLVQVIFPDGKTTAFSKADLEDLPQFAIEVGGKTEEGPSLSSVIQSVGVQDYSEVTLEGLNSTLTLSREQLTDDVLLDFTNRDTMKLAAVDIPKKDWVKDITRIMVK